MLSNNCSAINGRSIATRYDSGDGTSEFAGNRLLPGESLKREMLELRIQTIHLIVGSNDLWNEIQTALDHCNTRTSCVLDDQ